MLRTNRREQTVTHLTRQLALRQQLQQLRQL